MSGWKVLFSEDGVCAGIEELRRGWLGALWENELFRDRGSVLIRVGLNQSFYPFDDAVHAGGHGRGGGLRAVENTFRIRSMLRVTRHLLHLVSFNARGRKRMVMAGRAGKELRRQAVFFINEGFLVFVVDKSNGDFLSGNRVSHQIEMSRTAVHTLLTTKSRPSITNSRIR